LSALDNTLSPSEKASLLISQHVKTLRPLTQQSLSFYTHNNADALGGIVASKRKTAVLLATLTLILATLHQAATAIAVDNATVIIIGPQPTIQLDPFLRIMLQLVMAVMVLALLASLLLLLSETFTIPSL